MFAVKFGKGLKTELSYKHLPESKTYRFASDAEAEGEGELVLNIGLEREPLIVTEDGEPIDRVERKGEYLKINKIRPNVTYEVRKLNSEDLPTPE